MSEKEYKFDSEPFFQEEAIAFAKGYHFDNDKMDPRFDTARVLGRFEGDWTAEVEKLVAQSKSLTFNTRGHSDFVNYDPPKPHKNEHQGTHETSEAEFFEKVGFGEGYYDYKIINKVNPTVSSVVQKMIDCFAFEEPAQNTVHVQLTGQCFPWHMDIFQNRGEYIGVDKSKLMRVHVLLTDWQPGQWFGYGNYTYTHWKAGEFHTFDLDNVPHYTANASYHPRVSLMITGMRTEATDKFLWDAFYNKTYKI
jgi:hypothetical protein